MKSVRSMVIILTLLSLIGKFTPAWSAPSPGKLTLGFNSPEFLQLKNQMQHLAESLVFEQIERSLETATQGQIVESTPLPSMSKLQTILATPAQSLPIYWNHGRSVVDGILDLLQKNQETLKWEGILRAQLEEVFFHRLSELGLVIPTNRADRLKWLDEFASSTSLDYFSPSDPDQLQAEGHRVEQILSAFIETTCPREHRDTFRRIATALATNIGHATHLDDPARLIAMQRAIAGAKRTTLSTMVVLRIVPSQELVTPLLMNPDQPLQEVLRQPWIGNAHTTLVEPPYIYSHNQRLETFTLWLQSESENIPVMRELAPTLVTQQLFRVQDYRIVITSPATPQNSVGVYQITLKIHPLTESSYDSITVVASVNYQKSLERWDYWNFDKRVLQTEDWKAPLAEAVEIALRQDSRIQARLGEQATALVTNNRRVQTQFSNCREVLDGYRTRLRQAQ